MRGLHQKEQDSKAINAQSADGRVALTSCLGGVSASVGPLLAPAGNLPWFGCCCKSFFSPGMAVLEELKMFLEVSEDFLS